MMRLMTGFSRTAMTRLPVSPPEIVTSAKSCVAYRSFSAWSRISVV